MGHSCRGRASMLYQVRAESHPDRHTWSDRRSPSKQPCQVIYRPKADMLESVLIKTKHLLRWYLEITHSYHPETLRLKPPACSTGYSTSSRRTQGMGQTCYGNAELIHSLQRRPTGQCNAQLPWNTHSNTPVNCQQNSKRYLELQSTQTSQFTHDTETQGHHKVNGANSKGVAHEH